jgi:hypothetical protein
MNDAQLRDAMRRRGITDPGLTLRVARAVGLPLPYACTVLELETSGGRNVFGRDPGYHGPYKGLPVTHDRYLAYRRHAAETGEHNGVGYTQLTSEELQVRADELGGCWRPEPNVRVGFGFLCDLIREAGSAEAGFTRYNGSAAYGRRAIERAAVWERALDTDGSNRVPVGRSREHPRNPP